MHGLKYRCFMAACIMMGAGCLSLAGAQQGTSKDPVLPGEYRIGAGDVLQIVVWKEPDASLQSTVVRVDGKISVPLIGEVNVAGLTPTELKEFLVEKFSHYINNPVVTVDAKEIHSRKVYLVGNVKTEAPIPLTGPMTVLQAIDVAGGLAEFASKKKIYVLRNVDGKQVKLPFDYSAVIRGKHLEQNIALLPDDTIVVP
jgi:polysaccharide export outer membrane protein